jgi:hypothetical protein
MDEVSLVLRETDVSISREHTCNTPSEELRPPSCLLIYGTHMRCSSWRPERAAYLRPDERMDEVFTDPYD